MCEMCDAQWKADEAEAKMEELIHYPRCWDTACYPTLDSAVDEIRKCGPLESFVCQCQWEGIL